MLDEDNEMKPVDKTYLIFEEFDIKDQKSFYSLREIS